MVQYATFQFYDELNDFLPHHPKHSLLQHCFDWRASIKDMVESLGVPHSEIELLLVNERSVDFNYIVQDGDAIQVFPHFEAVQHPHKVRLRPPLEAVPNFVLDTHLGRLAAYLRMLGFDTLYRNDYSDDELAQISHTQNRVLLTRDIGLLKRSLVVYGYFVRSTDPKQRLQEIVQRFDLSDLVEPFAYCMACNGELQQVHKRDIRNRISDKTAHYFDVFHQCTDCGKVYWRGSHYERMQSFMQNILD